MSPRSAPPPRSAFAGVLRVVGTLGLASGLLGCDLATKSAARTSLADGPLVLTSFLDLRYTLNDDIAFSFLHRIGFPQHPYVLFAVQYFAGLIVCGLLAVGLAQARRAGAEPTPRGQRMLLAGVGCFLAGFLGNLIERVTRGGVTDFIHVHRWPVFNVADILICVAFGLVLLGWPRKTDQPSAPAKT